ECGEEDHDVANELDLEKEPQPNECSDCAEHNSNGAARISFRRKYGRLEHGPDSAQHPPRGNRVVRLGSPGLRPVELNSSHRQSTAAGGLWRPDGMAELARARAIRK